MKKIISLILSIIIISGIFAGCGNAEKNANTDTEQEKVTVRLGGLKGPTSMGMVKLLSDNENGLCENKYEFSLSATADEITPKIVKGELDIVAVPANLASVLYNKTNGNIKMIAVNMLGAVYIAEKGGNTVKSLADLKGKTVYATGKGSTPEYVLTYLLSQNGIDINKDVNIEWKSEPAETVAIMKTRENAIAMIPQPYTAVAETQIEDLKIKVDLYEEWKKLDNNSEFVTAGLIVRKDFAEENGDAVKAFLEEYKKSTEYAKKNVVKASALIEKYGIVKAEIAEKSLPGCHIVCITGDKMQKASEGYFKVLYNQNSASVGGKLPEKDFYIIY